MRTQKVTVHLFQPVFKLISWYKSYKCFKQINLTGHDKQGISQFVLAGSKSQVTLF